MARALWLMLHRNNLSDERLQLSPGQSIWTR